MAVIDDPGKYCREVEAYLCRKNDGHLIRIVGPAFEQVCGWATRGIPIKIVLRGIDRYFERYYEKGPRRRPVRVEFCEADVLDMFDDWKRAVGVGSAVQIEGDCSDENVAAARKRVTLPAHLDRLVSRLTAPRAWENCTFSTTLDDIVLELDVVRTGSRKLRGEAREALFVRLRVLDLYLLEAARASCDAQMLQRFGTEADVQLAPFYNRMSTAVYSESKQACIDRLIREYFGLPVIAYE